MSGFYEVHFMQTYMRSFRNFAGFYRELPT